MEIVQERLEREYGLNLILTVPNVVYRTKTIKGELLEVDTPAKFPSQQDIAEAQEPYVALMMIIPVDAIENVCDYWNSPMECSMRARGYLGGPAFAEWRMPDYRCLGAAIRVASTGSGG